MRVGAHLLRREVESEEKVEDCEDRGKKRPPWGPARDPPGLWAREKIAGVAKGWSGERNEYESN